MENKEKGEYKFGCRIKHCTKNGHKTNKHAILTIEKKKERTFIARVTLYG